MFWDIMYIEHNTCIHCITKNATVFDSTVMYVCHVHVENVNWIWKQVTKQCSYMRERLSMPVRLGVYYESLCPDSEKFIVDKLQPVYSKLFNITFLELVPYGNAKVCKSNNCCVHFITSSV